MIMTAWYRYLGIWLLLGSLVLSGTSGRANAGEPLEKIRQTVDDVVTVLSDETLKAPERTEERRQKIRQAVFQRFGFDEMAQRALAQHWRKRTPEEQKEFVALFSDLLERSYIDKIESYGGGKQNILYTKETIDKDGYASVRSEIVNKRDMNVEVEYRLLQRDGNWAVYDVVIEGVSLVNNYRTQFNKIIMESSYENLVKQMKLKLDQEKSVLDGKN
jgi:phospholipid transport system substrate-binding protein